MAEIDIETNDFPREVDGSINQSICDFYIKCKKGIKIFHYGGNLLEAYIPSKGVGRNIIKAIKDAGLETKVFNVEENDKEVFFKFKYADIDLLEQYLQPRTNGSSISPLSIKNLPKEKYDIPPTELAKYEAILASIKDSDILVIAHLTKRFLSCVVAKKYKHIDINADMRKQKLSRNRKGYIHKIGMWDNYLNYLEKELAC